MNHKSEWLTQKRLPNKNLLLRHMSFNFKRIELFKTTFTFGQPLKNKKFEMFIRISKSKYIKIVKSYLENKYLAS